MRIVVGVSGGADSVCLLQVLCQLAQEYGLQLHVAHLNHMLRPEAAADAAFVQELAHRRGLPVTVGYARVGAIAGRLRLGLEEAGRLARYRLFDCVADRVGAQRIAVAHHADDQVETVLLNILRGAGPAGLAGMRPRRGRIIRPLLFATREEIAAYCRDQGLAWRRDASNLSREFLRNRIRHQLLPLLRKEYNPGLDRAILRLAEVVQEEDAWLGRCTRRLFRLLLVRSGPSCESPQRRRRVRVAARDACLPAGLVGARAAAVRAHRVPSESGGVTGGGMASRRGTIQKAAGGIGEAPAPVESRADKDLTPHHLHPASPKAVWLDLAGFLGLPLALRRRLLREAVATVRGDLRRLGYRNVDDCLDFLERGGTGGTVELPRGIRVSKGRTSFSVFKVEKP
jgi:tRNA(Ile)-lysidine synthetase-like protein